MALCQGEGPIRRGGGGGAGRWSPGEPLGSAHAGSHMQPAQASGHPHKQVDLLQCSDNAGLSAGCPAYQIPELVCLVAIWVQDLGAETPARGRGEAAGGHSQPSVRAQEHEGPL